MSNSGSSGGGVAEEAHELKELMSHQLYSFHKSISTIPLRTTTTTTTTTRTLGVVVGSSHSVHHPSVLPLSSRWSQSQAIVPPTPTTNPSQLTPSPQPITHESFDSSNSGILTTSTKNKPVTLKTTFPTCCGLCTNKSDTENRTETKTFLQEKMLEIPPINMTNLTHCPTHYCAECEREIKRSRTLRFGSGGDVIEQRTSTSLNKKKVPITTSPRWLKDEDEGDEPPSQEPEEMGRKFILDRFLQDQGQKDDDADDLWGGESLQLEEQEDETTSSSSPTSPQNKKCFTVSLNLPTTAFELDPSKSSTLNINIKIREKDSLKGSGPRTILEGHHKNSNNTKVITTSRTTNNGWSSPRTQPLIHEINIKGKILSAQQLEDLRVMDETRALLSQCGWYYQCVDWQESIRLLKSTPIGTFFLRDSGDPRFMYSLSVQTEFGPISSRISYNNGKFRLDSQDRIIDLMPSFTSIISLIQHYIKNGIVKNPSGRQVWVDSNGLTFSPVQLTKPKRNVVGSLQHLSRLVVNGSPDLLSQSKSLPPRIQGFLGEYPYGV